MNPVEQDIARRKNEIIAEVNALFHANIKFTDWDVPEADDALAAKLILEIMQEAIDGLKAKLDAGELEE
jgi:hypothetical protein